MCSEFVGSRSVLIWSYDCARSFVFSSSFTFFNGNTSAHVIRINSILPSCSFIISLSYFEFEFFGLDFIVVIVCHLCHRPKSSVLLDLEFPVSCRPLCPTCVAARSKRDYRRRETAAVNPLTKLMCGTREWRFVELTLYLMSSLIWCSAAYFSPIVRKRGAV